LKEKLPRSLSDLELNTPFSSHKPEKRLLYPQLPIYRVFFVIYAQFIFL